MSILSGMFPPTSGTALINGFDIRRDIESIHSCLGVCPQFNALFDELTIEEHLRFYCRLKRFDNESIDDEVNKIIDILAIKDKRNEFAMNLSGGTKRKLSVMTKLIYCKTIL